MFGYITPLKSELRIREFEVYNAYYCAICHAVKRRYGELPRLMLSYDAVLIAMLAAAITGAPERPAFTSFRCFNNPLKKRNEAVPSAAVDYAADVMVLLGWLSLKDGKEDRDAANPLKGFATVAGEATMRRAGRRATDRLGDKAGVCRECTQEQSELEKAKTDSLDRAADPTGRLMAEVMDFTGVPGLCGGGGDGLPRPGRAEDEKGMARVLRGLGYHLGRYIYIIDAVDDFGKDRKSGAYNPLLLRPYSKEALKTAISLDLAQIGSLMEGLSLLYHKDIIDNIVYLGLRARADDVLEGFRVDESEGAAENGAEGAAGREKEGFQEI